MIKLNYVLNIEIVWESAGESFSQLENNPLSSVHAKSRDFSRLNSGILQNTPCLNKFDTLS